MLKKEQLFNKQIINAIPGGFYLLDANGKFVAWNDQVQKNSFGVAEDEMIGTIGLEVIHPDDRSRAFETLQNVIHNGTESTQEFRVVRRGESAIEWRLMTGKRIIIDGTPFLIGVSIDITDRKHAEAALLKSEERFRTLFNSSSAIQALLDPDTGKVLEVNQTAAEWYGWPAKKLRQMYTRDVNTLSQAEIEKSLQTVDAREHNKFIGQHRRADGSIRDVEIYRNKIDLEGKPVIHAIIHDITERKLAEAELERLNRVLMVSDQCNKALIHGQDERELLQKICSSIVESGGYRMVWVGFAMDDEAKSLLRAASAGSTGDYFESITISWGENKYGQGPAGTAIRTGQPFSVNHILTDPQFKSWHSRAIKNGYAAVLGLPLSIDNRVVGALTIYSEQPDAFNAAETLQLTSLTDNLAFGIKMLRQNDALKKMNRSMRYGSAYSRWLIRIR
ncbi:MAG: PAS domain S-box protein [Chlorobiaceae bacterium]